MSHGHRLGWRVAATIAIVAALAYLRDPPWLDRVTSGLGPWTEDASGTRFRWTTGHASFYVPADAFLVTVPIRLGAARADGLPARASVAVDGRVFSTLLLDDPVPWIPVTFSTPRAAAGRPVVRVDVRVDRVLRRHMLGVQVGVITVRARRGPPAVRQ